MLATPVADPPRGFFMPVPSIALLWDESHLWGLLAWRGLTALGARPWMVRACHVAGGALDAQPPAVLLVPGGWAGHKAAALGEAGRSAIRRYVAQGGRYLGICGGAGLALQGHLGAPLLGLCQLRRKAAAQRLPNCSGHVRCRLYLDGDDATAMALLPIWWPSQFETPGRDARVLAAYESPAPDFWVADLPLADLAEADIPAWEVMYGINLHPRWLVGDPCILSLPFGAGEVILSYAHLETPESTEANTLLARLLGLPPGQVPAWDIRAPQPILWHDPCLTAIHAALLDLIDLGQRHFLLTWRTPWLLGWRRGIPAAHLTTLLAMTAQAMTTPPSAMARQWWQEHGVSCARLCAQLCQEARAYLVQERHSLTQSPGSPEQAGSRALQETRCRLFGAFPGYGGLYGQVVAMLDELLARLIAPEGDDSSSGP